MAGVVWELRAGTSRNESQHLDLDGAPADANMTPAPVAAADSYRDSIAEDWTHLYDAHLALPPANLDWYHAVPIDRVFKLNAGSAWGWTSYNRWLNLKLSTHAPCGVYRASNAGRSAGST